MKPNKQVAAATMKDVALKAKVSTATVSRALMNPDKVSQSRGLRSNDVKNHDKKITCCFYLKKAETFLLLM
ncbi:LacI family DNA-binding transcriptional regulator, partial [Citrobacter freundii]|uniref:LacI family DNA-binding transcriptional regulator n=1 Tax=Citrobacter freundii TaxID=546 RepID=UPI0023B21D89